MSEWNIEKLGDVAVTIQPGPFGSQLHRTDYSETGIPIIMPKDMIGGHIDHTNLSFVSEEHVKRLSRHQVHTGDLIVARKGDVRKCVYISEKENGWMTGSDCLKVTLDNSKCVSRFIYYQLRTPFVGKLLETISIGSTMPSINSGLLSSIEIHLPTIEIQQKITKILKCYDDLIENNNSQMKLLEEAAQRLYKEWFVDLHFPGYENCKIVNGVPEGWRKKTVGDLIGKVPRTTQISASCYKMNGEIPVIDQSKVFIAGYTDEKSALVDLHMPVIVFGDHTRILKYIQFPFARGADGTQLIVSRTTNMPQSLLYYGLVNIDLSNYHYARHFKYLKAESLLVPDKKIAELFDGCVSVLQEKIQDLRDEMYLSAEARDRLLPKLMSGEIEV